MAQLIILFWRDIPAQVIAESGRGRNRQQAKIELPRRFAIAIDAAAMKDGADSTDDYLAEWRRSEPVLCSDDLDLEVTKLAADIDAHYPAERVRKLVESGGFDRDSPHFTNT